MTRDFLYVLNGQSNFQSCQNPRVERICSRDLGLAFFFCKESGTNMTFCI